MTPIATAALLLVAANAPVASTPLGDWTVKDQSARITIHECGGNLCGNVSWSADGGGVGDAVLVDMKPDGARWTGTVIDTRNGRHYTAHVALKSDDALRLDGCVMGGLICSGETWTRYTAPAAPAATASHRGARHG